MARLATETNSITKPHIDPVCGMKVYPTETDLVATHQGEDYYFCAEACRKAFEADPKSYLKNKQAKLKGPKGWWGRYLERVAKANKELFGDSHPRCH